MNNHVYYWLVIFKHHNKNNGVTKINLLTLLQENNMGKIITQCPSCSSTKLQVTKIECLDCATQFAGQFEVPALLKLQEDDLQFVFDFVKCSGSLKEMAVKQSVSYPTLRNRLNALIETMENLEIQKEGSKAEILQLVEEGKLSAKEAAKMLNKL